MKILKRGEEQGIYLAEWQSGYIQFWEDWSQYLRPRRYNWLNFRPIWFEIDYDKLAGEHVSLEFGFLGLNLRFHQFVKDNERGRKLRKEVEDIKTIDEAHKEEVERLRAQIRDLKARLKR
ncbi:MAG: hypothetical protein ACC618_00585 [Patescibacteria group bacterium]